MIFIFDHPLPPVSADGGPTGIDTVEPLHVFPASRGGEGVFYGEVDKIPSGPFGESRRVLLPFPFLSLLEEFQGISSPSRSPDLWLTRPHPLPSAQRQWSRAAGSPITVAGPLGNFTLFPSALFERPELCHMADFRSKVVSCQLKKERKFPYCQGTGQGSLKRASLNLNPSELLQC